jgi:hypothetical protein
MSSEEMTPAGRSLRPWMQAFFGSLGLGCSERLVLCVRSNAINRTEAYVEARKR